MAQMCVGGLSGSTGRLKMLEPLSHKANKTAWASEAKIALFSCDFNSLIAIKVGHVLQNIRQVHTSLSGVGDPCALPGIYALVCL